MELIQDAANQRQVEQALKLVTPLARVWPSPQDSDTVLSFFQRYHLSHGLGLLDSLVAACALGQGAELATFNAKHYRVVPGLRLLQRFPR